MADLAPNFETEWLFKHTQSRAVMKTVFPIEGGWSEYKKLWAKVTPLSAKDLIAAQAINPKKLHE